jgi:ATP/maltotriose-dependent transcriptional regulator MalT
MVEETLLQATRMEAPRAIALCRSFGGVLDFQAGQWEQAERALRESIQLYRSIGAASGESLSLQRLAVLLTAKGEIDAAMRSLNESAIAAERATLRSHCLTRIYSTMVRNRLAAGANEEASQYLIEAESYAKRHGQCLTCNALVLPEAVRAHVAAGRIGAASARASELEEIASRYGSRAWTAMSRQARARVLEAEGDRARARVVFAEAAAAYDAFGAAYDAARCRLGEARALAPDDPTRAELVLKEARAVITALGAAGIES